MRVFLSALAIVACGIISRADEENIALDQLPKAVMESVKKRFPQGELISAVVEKVNKKTTFEVILKHGGQRIDVNLQEDGTMTGFEKEVAIKDLPKKVLAAAVKKHPNAKTKKGEEVYTIADGKETLAYYEVIFEIDGKDVEVEVLPNGKLK